MEVRQLLKKGLESSRSNRGKLRREHLITRFHDVQKEYRGVRKGTDALNRDWKLLALRLNVSTKRRTSAFLSIAVVATLSDCLYLNRHLFTEKPLGFIGFHQSLLHVFVCDCPYRSAQAPQAKTNIREKEKQILDKILQPNLYDRRIRPSGANGTGMQITIKT